MNQFVSLIIEIYFKRLVKSQWLSECNKTWQLIYQNYVEINDAKIIIYGAISVRVIYYPGSYASINSAKLIYRFKLTFKLTIAFIEDS